MSNTLAKDKPSETSLTQTDIRLKYLFDYGVDFKNRTITIDGEIDTGDFGRLDAAMSELESDSRKAITIRIHSPGGDVYDALAIIGRIRASKCHIITEGYGQIMSAAILILACGDKRRMSKYAWAMAHEASYEASGTHATIQDVVAQSEREHVLWSNYMAEHSNLTSTAWRLRINKEDAYLTAQQCLELNIVDELI